MQENIFNIVEDSKVMGEVVEVLFCRHGVKNVQMMAAIVADLGNAVSSKLSLLDDEIQLEAVESLIDILTIVVKAQKEYDRLAKRAATKRQDN